jgi:hypothetical protein
MNVGDVRFLLNDRVTFTSTIAGCPVVRYDLCQWDSNGACVNTTAHPNFTLDILPSDPEGDIYLKISTDTTMEVTSFRFSAHTVGEQEEEITFNVGVCGSETLSLSSSYANPIKMTSNVGESPTDVLL